MKYEMTVDNIAKALRIKYYNHLYHLKNAYIFRYDWESDFFCMSNAGYFYEFEIKLSRSDYFADFKKNKHDIMKAANLVHDPEHMKVPHRFFFVVPDGMIQPEEVPNYAGLLYVGINPKDGSNTIHQAKSSPFIKRSVKPIGLVQPMGCKRQSELALRKNVLANSIRRCLTDGTNKVTIRPEHILVPIVLTKCGRV